MATILFYLTDVEEGGETGTRLFIRPASSVLPYLLQTWSLVPH